METSRCRERVAGSGGLESRGFTFLVLGTCLSLALAPPAAEACSCVQTATVTHPCQTHQEESVVFLGRAIEEPVVRRLEDGFHDRIYRFAVEEAFAGVTGSTVEIVTGMGNGDCGLDFEVGRLTFVDAWYDESGTEIVVSLCGTKTTGNLGSPHLAYARARAAGEPGPAIFGRVTRGPVEPDSSFQDREGLGGVKVAAYGESGEKLEAFTDPEGFFEIPGPLAGRFTVRAAVPGVVASSLEAELKVDEGRCQGVELVAGSKGK